MPFGIAWWEILLLLVVALLLFGAKRLPEMGRSLGSGMREFKDAITGKGGGEDDERRELPSPSEEERLHAARERERDSVTP